MTGEIKTKKKNFKIGWQLQVRKKIYDFNNVE